MPKTSRVLLLVASFCVVGAACSSDRGSGGSVGEAIGSQAQGLTGKCQTQTFQLPCDPDDSGPLTECEGMCTHDATGKMQCVPIAALGMSNLDGRLCGDDTTCSSICQGTVCTVQQAPDGLSCRPTNAHDRCAGSCLSGQCVLVDANDKCTYGRQGQTNCTFQACDMFNATTCVTISIGVGVSCSDNDSCTVGDSCSGSGSCGINICDGGSSLDGGTGAGGSGAGTGGSAGAPGTGG